MVDGLRYAALRQDFIDGFARALDRLSRRGTVYAIAVDPGDLYDRAFLYANTLEALPDVSDEMGHLALKWSIADWQYQAFEAEDLGPFNDGLAALVGDVYVLDRERLVTHCEDMRAFYADALSSGAVTDLLSLRFGAERPLLGLFGTDQSDEAMIASAEGINPPAMTARLRDDLQRLRHLQLEVLSVLEN
jgi:hypothetical protein